MALQPTGRNRRRFERRNYVAQVSMKAGEATSTLPVGNISAGGIYLKLKRTQNAGVALGDNVIVYFDVGPDEYGDALDLEVDAEVVRIDMGGIETDPGIALMWTSTDPLVAQQLALVLEHLQKLA